MQLSLFDIPVPVETLPEGASLKLLTTCDVVYFIREHYTMPKEESKIIVSDNYTQIRFIDKGTLVLPVAEKQIPRQN